MPEAAATDREAHIARFLAANGWGKAARGRLAGDASFRHYDRLEMAGKRAVLMDAPPPVEDVRPYAAVAELLRNMGYSAPRIFAADAEHGLLLLEDFGDDTYTRLFARGHDETKLYGLAVDLLIDLHRKFAPARHSGLPAFDDTRALREVSLVLDWYWPATQEGPVTPELRDSYLAAWRTVLPKRHAMPDTLVLFDYHVDNLMLLPDRHRHRRLRPARFPGRPGRARAPSIWSRCCRTCAATCRRNWSPPCASATSRPSPLSTARPSIPATPSSAPSATRASSAPSPASCCATANPAISSTSRGPGSTSKMTSPIRRWPLSAPGSIAISPLPRGARPSSTKIC